MTRCMLGLVLACLAMAVHAQDASGVAYSRAGVATVPGIRVFSPAAGAFAAKSAADGEHVLVEVRVIAAAKAGRFGPIPLSSVRLTGTGLSAASGKSFTPIAVGTLTTSCSYMNPADIAPGSGATVDLNSGVHFRLSHPREAGPSFGFEGKALALCFAFELPRGAPGDLSLNIAQANMPVPWSFGQARPSRRVELPETNVPRPSLVSRFAASIAAWKWPLAAVLLGIAVVLYLLRRRLRQGIKAARAVIRAAAIAGHGPAVPELEGETPPLASESNRNLVEAGADGLSDAQLALQNGDFELAERRLQEALGRSLSPEQVALAHLMMGGTALARGNLVDAASAFYRCVTGDRLYQQSGVPAAANLEAIYRCLGMPRGADRAHRIVALIPGQLEQLPQQQIARIRQLARPIRWRWRLYGLRAWPQALSSFVQAVLAAPAAEAATDPQ